VAARRAITLAGERSQTFDIADQIPAHRSPSRGDGRHARQH
jgi:hypothetical protein